MTPLSSTQLPYQMHRFEDEDTGVDLVKISFREKENSIDIDPNRKEENSIIIAPEICERIHKFIDTDEIPSDITPARFRMLVNYAQKLPLIDGVPPYHIKRELDSRDRVINCFQKYYPNDHTVSHWLDGQFGFSERHLECSTQIESTRSNSVASPRFYPSPAVVKRQH